VDVEKDGRVIWLAEITNEKILNKVEDKRQLISVIKSRKKNWIYRTRVEG